MKMIVLDLDGTLLTDEENISDYSLSILEKCKKAGIKIVIATGRAMNSAKEFIDLVNPDYSIVSDGELVYDKNNQVIYIKLLNPEILEATNGYVDKMPGIEVIAEDLGIPLSDITAFGDDYNDLKMIENCGTGIAMKNAVDILKESAKYICESNNDDGAAKWIDANLL